VVVSVSDMSRIVRRGGPRGNSLEGMAPRPGEVDDHR